MLTTKPLLIGPKNRQRTLISPFRYENLIRNEYRVVVSFGQLLPKYHNYVAKRQNSEMKIDKNQI